MHTAQICLWFVFVCFANIELWLRPCLLLFRSFVCHCQWMYMLGDNIMYVKVNLIVMDACSLRWLVVSPVKMPVVN